ncbi:MAG: ferric reductase-like transmembrane domain-containing protein [Chloroflexota bacterium]|nr:ferric reductase-like transmembrane domain-containing protein [Chloroflexota bacterium]
MNHEFWYLSRAAGFTAYLLLFASAVLGIAMSTKLAARFKRGNFVFDLHRFVSILAMMFSFFHVYILLGDHYFSFSVWQLSAPLASPYRTLATALGVISLYAMVLIMGSFYVKRFIGYRTWRAIHFLTFAMYGSVTLHGVLAGTDTTAVWARFIYASTGAALLMMVAYRINQSPRASDSAQRARTIANGSTAALGVAVALVGSGLTGSGLTALIHG